MTKIYIDNQEWNAVEGGKDHTGRWVRVGMFRDGRCHSEHLLPIGWVNNPYGGAVRTGGHLYSHRPTDKVE